MIPRRRFPRGNCQFYTVSESLPTRRESGDTLPTWRSRAVPVGTTEPFRLDKSSPQHSRESTLATRPGPDSRLLHGTRIDVHNARNILLVSRCPVGWCGPRTFGSDGTHLERCEIFVLPPRATAGARSRPALRVRHARLSPARRLQQHLSQGHDSAEKRLPAAIRAVSRCNFPLVRISRP